MNYHLLLLMLITLCFALVRGRMPREYRDYEWRKYMKKFVLLFAIGLLLVACGSTSTETAVSVPEEPTNQVADSTEDQPVAESETETESEPGSETTEEVAISGFPATTVEEATVVRDRDWVKGTDDPLVAIIEYGDFQ
jgi:cytoskeletal protein RodZ